MCSWLRIGSAEKLRMSHGCIGSGSESDECFMAAYAMGRRLTDVLGGVWAGSKSDEYRMVAYGLG